MVAESGADSGADKGAAVMCVREMEGGRYNNERETMKLNAAKRVMKERA